MIPVTVVVNSPDHPSPLEARALAHAEAAVRRFPNRAELRVLAADDPWVVERGLGLAPTVLVGPLLLAAGQAPPAGHLVRAIAAALAREDEA